MRGPSLRGCALASKSNPNQAKPIRGTGFAFVTDALCSRRSMTRLEGKKTNLSAILVGAVIFILVAAGLYLAFRPVREPADASNAVQTIVADDTGAAQNQTDTSNGASSNSLTDNSATDNSANAQSATEILTPLPTASAAPTATSAPVAPMAPVATPLAKPGAAAQPSGAPNPTVPKPLDLSNAPPPPLPPPPASGG